MASIFQNSEDVVAGQSVIRRQVAECPCIVMVLIQPVFEGAEPDTPFAVFKDTDDDVATDAVGVIERKVKNLESIRAGALEVEAIFGTHPKVAAAIDENGTYKV